MRHQLTKLKITWDESRNKNSTSCRNYDKQTFRKREAENDIYKSLAAWQTLEKLKSLS